VAYAGIVILKADRILGHLDTGGLNCVADRPEGRANPEPVCHLAENWAYCDKHTRQLAFSLGDLHLSFFEHLSLCPKFICPFPSAPLKLR